MLTLKNITKDYLSGENTVHALSGVSLSFRNSEFVAVLGQSGCGKTTLLNIIGGLDHYTDGDLIINGKSTKAFRDGDWDVYRNRAIGFVFQSYNLIPHQSVLANVELALTLSGVSRAERRARAVAALEEVGLGDQLKKKPNQMSGGQMQRVAIARALVNNPDIILADEPTGALDTETSIQVMELLKEVAKDRLVIMVTHNPELADRYASRTVRLLDGRVVDDTNPYEGETENTEKPKKIRKKPMRFSTANGLSLRNLMTKKTRTILTAFAGSIGIIGIALILSLSNGIQNYIDQVQEETLTSYPITIEAESVDMSSLMTSLMGVQEEAENQEEHEPDRVYSSTVMAEMMNSLISAEVQTNDLETFKQFLDEGGNGIADMATIRYGYDFDYRFYTEDEDGNIVKSDVMTLIESAMASMYGGDYSSYFDTMGSMYTSFDVWQELLPGEDGALISSQVKDSYELLYGTWPQSYDEAVLFVSSNNEISDLMLYALGYISESDMTEALSGFMDGETVETEARSWSYAELCENEFKLILPAECYQKDSETGTYTDVTETETGLEYLYNNDEIGTTIRIVGVVRPTGDSAVTGSIGYTEALTKHAMEATADTEIVRQQQNDQTVDVICNLPFATGEETEPTAEEKQSAITEYLSGLSEQEKASVYTDVMSQPSEAYLETVVETQLSGITREDLEATITEQYAAAMGVDSETVQSYIAGMEDDELFGMVGESMREQVKEEYAAAVAQQLSALSVADLAAALDMAMEGETAAVSETAAAETAAEAPESVPTGSEASEATQASFAETSVPDGVDPELYAQYMSGETLPEGMSTEEAAALAGNTGTASAIGGALTEEQYDYLYETYMPATVSESSYEDNLELLGYRDPAKPTTISLYASTFEEKDAIADIIAEYNETAEEEITYTDYVAMLMSSITTIINAISYVLIAFVAISLVVSSIMIGIITYISVLERTKEIGILRAIGASKKDISRVFNAETIIEGLVSGLIGIGVTLILIVPINLIIRSLTGIEEIGAELPAAAGVILVAISVLLTFIAGLIPSSVAAKKDPVEALRTE